MPVRFSRASRLMWSVSLCTRQNREITVSMIATIISSRAATNPAVMAERVRLLLTILMMAHIAMMGDLMRICRPMDTSICTWG